MNIFAQVARGLLVQPGMQREQEALGSYAGRFQICCNLPENDLRWDSLDPSWHARASMSKRHRFLTTKDLHWQWFNALVFGLAEEDGAVNASAALREVEDMKTAALHYAQNVGGWSSEVGLFVNVFGHNSVNSLFVHILDMKELGPAFQFQAFKTLPLEDVIKVLREEASAESASPPAQAVVPRRVSVTVPNARRLSIKRGSGSTSLKEELVGRVPVLQDAASFREARRLLREELGGPLRIRDELLRVGLVDEQTDMLTTNMKPFNLFALVAAGKMAQPNMEAEQEALGEYKDRFCVCRNRPENDDHWDSEAVEWVGKASMSCRHRFLTTRDLNWQWFNVLSFGMVPLAEDEDLNNALTKAIELLEAMRAAALTYTSNVGGWSERVGLFFHVFGHNSVNSLHLHIVDMDVVGPTFWNLNYKNCPLDAVLKVLRENLALTLAVPTPGASPRRSVEVSLPLGGGLCLRGPVNVRKASISSCSVGSAELASVLEESGEAVLELSVGGEAMTVAQATLLLAPRESRLQELLESSHRLGGQLVLDLPPVAFRRVLDRLRLRRLAPLACDSLLPPQDPADAQEFCILAEALGVGALVLGAESPGRSVDRLVGAATAALVVAAAAVVALLCRWRAEVVAR